MRVLDLFSGMGGFSLGFKQAGFHIDEGIDHWKDAINTYENRLQTKGRLINIADYCPSQKDFDLIIIGGSPCQDFSQINLNANPYSKRAQLSLDYCRIIHEVKPEIFVFENVITLPKWVRLALMNIPGYQVTMQKINSLEYNVAQDRERLIFIGSRKKAIFLNKLNAYLNKKVLTVKEVFSSITDNWGFVNHRKETVEKFKSIQSENWENINQKKGKFKAVLRLQWNKPAPTIANVKKLQILHPKEHRVISLAEALMIQGFPEYYIPLGNDSSKAQQIANAVPPPMAQGIALTIKKFISDS